MTGPDLQSEAAKLKTWLIDKALPFWAENGRDAAGGWYEHLALDGTPNVDAIRRVRVQARQIYVYALAEKMGWYPGKEIATSTFDFMLEYGFETDGDAGFIHLITPDYTIENSRRDLYDHAFYLFACGWMHEVTGDPRALKTADKLQDLLATVKMDNGGWQEGIPNTVPRRQNPHMHLFEASMAWHDITGEPRWLNMADEIFALFKNHFFDSKNLIIREFFDADWNLIEGAPGKSSEPGHLVEWIWLLWMYQKRSGVDTSAYANALYEKILQKPGPFLNDEEDETGNPIRATKRLWVQTEVIKAHLAQANRGVFGAAEAASKAISTFRGTYLNANGTWTDQIDANGSPIADTIPVSTFYHIICMIYEALNCEP